MIKAEGLGKRYDLGLIDSGTLRSDFKRWWAKFRGLNEGVNDSSFWAIRDISFDVKEGEVLGIVGKNGAGKSTLLKILSHITRPTEGQVKIKGRMASLLEVGTGFNPDLSGRDNIFMNGMILGMTRSEIHSDFDAIVDFAGIGQFIDTPVKRYSSGMYVRLAFAVAAHLRPEILIVDEVLAVGDAEFQKKCLGKMSDVAANGRTVLFVSHNMTAMRSLCKRGLLLEKGKMIMDGEIMEVIDKYMGGGVTNFISNIKFNRDDSKEAQVIGLSFYVNGVETQSILDINHPFEVLIEYELRRPAAGMIVGFSIFQSKESGALLSSSEAELDSDLLKIRLPGVYKRKIKIPARLLNTGLFRMRIGITSHQTIYDVVDDIFFEMTDKVGIFQHLGYERKNSALSLQFRWEPIEENA